MMLQASVISVTTAVAPPAESRNALETLPISGAGLTSNQSLGASQYAADSLFTFSCGLCGRVLKRGRIYPGAWPHLQSQLACTVKHVIDLLPDPRQRVY